MPNKCTAMYVVVCWRMLSYADVCQTNVQQSMLAYGVVCWRMPNKQQLMLTYAVGYVSILTYAYVSIRHQTIWARTAIQDFSVHSFYSFFLLILFAHPDAYLHLCSDQIRALRYPVLVALLMHSDIPMHSDIIRALRYPVLVVALLMLISIQRPLLRPQFERPEGPPLKASLNVSEGILRYP